LWRQHWTDLHESQSRLVSKLETHEPAKQSSESLTVGLMNSTFFSMRTHPIPWGYLKTHTRISIHNDYTSYIPFYPLIHPVWTEGTPSFTSSGSGALDEVVFAFSI
jgi:hypothetical protein